MVQGEPKYSLLEWYEFFKTVHFNIFRNQGKLGDFYVYSYACVCMYIFIFIFLYLYICMCMYVCVYVYFLVNLQSGSNF